MNRRRGEARETRDGTGDEPLSDPAARAADEIRRRVGTLAPRVGIVLGSGLGGLADAVEGTVRIPTADLPGFPVATVKGHAGELIAGTLDGAPVMLQRGRVHMYEGHDPTAVVFPVRVLVRLGIEVLVVTNAAGGIRTALRPPVLMVIADHINLMWRNPLLGPVGTGEVRFPDMSEPYDHRLRALARDRARALRLRLEEGVYAGLLGPSYETPAEIRMLARLGADAVGMSTVPEVLVARAAGLRVLGISSITNLAAGRSHAKLSHEEVLEGGKRTAADLEKLVRAVVREV